LLENEDCHHFLRYKSLEKIPKNCWNSKKVFYIYSFWLWCNFVVFVFCNIGVNVNGGFDSFAILNHEKQVYTFQFFPSIFVI